MARLRALMISPVMPATSGGGLSIRAGLFLHSLTRIADTDLLVLPFGGLSLGQSGLEKSFSAHCRVIPLSGSTGMWNSIAMLARNVGKGLKGGGWDQKCFLTDVLTKAALEKIKKATEAVTYDLIHVGRSYMAEAGLAIGGGACKTLDADENDAQVCRRWAEILYARGDKRGADLKIDEAIALENLFHSKLDKFSIVFSSSEIEAQSLQRFCGDKRVLAITNTVPKPKSIQHKDDGRTLLFVGSLGYWPNAEGIHWFVKEVWPQIVANVPLPPKLLIVGRKGPNHVRSLSEVPGISIHEDVDSVETYYAQATIAIVPLWVGGGTRLKIIEAALFGIPVVSTPMGAEGLPFEDSQEILLAPDARTMAAKIVAGFSDQKRIKEIGQKAKIKALAQMDFKKTSDKLTRTWLDLLEQRRFPP